MPIEVKNISHIYMENTPYEKKALNNVSLTINEGEFVAIAGHTGSGKSTLMQHFNGLLNPTRGEVFIDGIDINKKKDKKTLHARRSVGMVFQYPEQQLFEESIFADIAFGPRNFGCSEDEVKQRVKEAMDFVELDYEEYKDKSPFLLSGGQMRRVAIAGIIALKPKYLVLDEPTAGMDTTTRQRFWEIINDLKKSGVTILYSSHYIEEVEHTADRILVLHQGRLIRDTTPHAMRSEEKEKQVTLPSRFAPSLDKLADIYDVTEKRDVITFMTKDIESVWSSLLAQGCRISDIEIQNKTLLDSLFDSTREDKS